MKIKERGITLIALIVTIIILLILAGVTLNVTLSDNGLFNKSKQAVEKYKDSERNEAEALDNAEEEIGKLFNEYGGSGTVTPPEEPKITGSKTSEIISKITGTETENTQVKIGEEIVIIPAGFTISEESAETVDGGIVVVDKVSNEWVWVPCTDFSRKDFGKQNGEYSEYSEEMPEDQNASVTKNKGYYIGRYEAGNDGSDKVIIQKNKTPYNYISIADCKTKSSSFANDNNYVTSKMFTVLCSSYAWDSTLTFIEKTNYGYATNSPQGNYDESLKNTGLTTPVCNIYDMGGNLWEYTTEFYSNTDNHYVGRGGYHSHDASDNPAGYRGYVNGIAYSFASFRPTLFLK